MKTILILAILILSAALTFAQDRQASQQNDEIKFLRVLQNQESERKSPDDILAALKGLVELSRQKLLKSPETYRLLTRYLDFPDIERVYISTPSMLNNYPAMCALYYLGDDALPYLVEVIVREKEGSRTYLNALLTVIYIKKDDFREAYAFLNNSAKRARSRQEREKLMAAAFKLAAYDPVK